MAGPDFGQWAKQQGLPEWPPLTDEEVSEAATLAARIDRRTSGQPKPAVESQGDAPND